MNNMRRKQKLQQTEIKNNFIGLVNHFFNHAEDMGINLDFNMEEIMKKCQTMVITSVDQYSIEKLKGLEADIIHSMKATLDTCGMKRICCCSNRPCIHSVFRLNVLHSLCKYKLNYIRDTYFQ